MPLYEHADDTKWSQVPEDREQMRNFGLGEGSEEHTALDEWCYSYGERGHVSTKFCKYLKSWLTILSSRIVRSQNRK